MTPITIRIANRNDFTPSPDFLEMLRLLEDAAEHRAEVLRVAGEMSISYAKAFEIVENTLEETLGRCRYPDSGYAGARVAACRLAKKQKIKTENKQLALF